MSLLDALKSPQESYPRKVNLILEKVTPDERAALEEALGKPKEWSAEALAKTLTELVEPIGASSIKRYRREVLGLTA